MHARGASIIILSVWEVIVVLERAAARELLGVGEDADADTLRRAYLRALKKHRPERDPEGFKRVREAYELLQTSIGARWAGPPPSALRPSALDEAPAGVDAPARDAPVEDLGSASLDALAQGDVDAYLGPAPHDPVEEAIWRAYDEALADGDTDAAVEALGR